MLPLVQKLLLKAQKPLLKAQWTPLKALLTLLQPRLRMLPKALLTLLTPLPTRLVKLLPPQPKQLMLPRVRWKKTRSKAFLRIPASPEWRTNQITRPSAQAGGLVVCATLAAYSVYA